MEHASGLNNSQVLAELVSDLFFRRLAKKFFFADESEKAKIHRRSERRRQAHDFLLAVKMLTTLSFFSRTYSACRASGICSDDFFYIFLSEKIN